MRVVPNDPSPDNLPPGPTSVWQWTELWGEAERPLLFLDREIDTVSSGVYINSHKYQKAH
ncbi:MAG: hypothetical protein HRT83_00135 [Hyphomicrobiaceae bacterium]|nr:hypothetical protein [Hyphomicrobiaceae bacterium]